MGSICCKDASEEETETAVLMYHSPTEADQQELFKGASDGNSSPTTPDSLAPSAALAPEKLASPEVGKQDSYRRLVTVTINAEDGKWPIICKLHDELPVAASGPEAVGNADSGVHSTLGAASAAASTSEVVLEVTPGPAISDEQPPASPAATATLLSEASKTAPMSQLKNDGDSR